MTQIDFYIPHQTFNSSKFQLACRLTEKAYQAGKRVCISTENESDAELIDKLLWTYSEQSFIPHDRCHESSTIEMDIITPVFIISQLAKTNEHEVLINLADKTPTCFSQFDRLLEPLDNDKVTKDSGRERYRYYRDCGYQINNHEIKH